jgi:hypothetical protein
MTLVLRRPVDGLSYRDDEMRVMKMMWVVALVITVLSVDGSGQGSRPASVIGGPMLHAHNCYPDEGRWSDRLERALNTGGRPIAIEQDLVWAVDGSGSGRSVVSHGAPLTGTEPTLETHFFERLAPVMRAALEKPDPSRWPLVVLHLDFKTNEPAHHQAIWDLLGKYESWLTTAPRTVSDIVQPMTRGPLLVITENGDGQAATFDQRVPIGARLRLFGTVPTVRVTESTDREVQAEALVSAPPETLIPLGASNYRRWVNFPWAVIERGGPTRAGTWDAGDARRLAAVVGRAHSLGLWVRFYTLNGHSPTENRGWSAGYNFGSMDAVRPRWQAAVAAGVEFIATDQYESFAGAR